MASQRTFVILKPDAVQRGLVGDILARFERKGRLDEFGHVVMTGCYDEREAELDDAAYYARYLLRHHRDGLLAVQGADDFIAFALQTPGKHVPVHFVIFDQ